MARTSPSIRSTSDSGASPSASSRFRSRWIGQRPRHSSTSARVRYPKSTLPLDVLASYGRPRLALLTCGGAFDERTRHYADNIVVVGLPEA